MLGEVALEIGQQLTSTEIVPLLPSLVKDGESIIRQRLCAELKILCLVLMGMTGSSSSSSNNDANANFNSNQARNGNGTTMNNNITSSLPQIPTPQKSSKYYKVMVHHIIPHLFTLITDPDNEVRRAASENIVKLALRVDVEDVVPLALSIPLRLVKEGQKRAVNGSAPSNGGTAAAANATTNANNGSTTATTTTKEGAKKNNNNNNNNTPNPQTPAEDLLITASNLLADLASFLPPSRLPPPITTKYLSPTILSLAEDPNFRVRRAAVQALPRMLGSATLDDVKRRLLPKFVGLSSDEMYRVRKASGECLVDVSRALGVLPWRIHFGDVWIDNDHRRNQQQQQQEQQNDDDNDDNNNSKNNNNNPAANQSNIIHNMVQSRTFYKPRTSHQISELNKTIQECHEIRRRALCAIAKKLLEDVNKFVRYGMMQFLGPLIASFYPLDRGSMVGGMGGMLYCGLDYPPPTMTVSITASTKANNGLGNNDEYTTNNLGTLGIGVESVGIAKGSTGLQRATNFDRSQTARSNTLSSIDDLLSYNHSLQGLELILHGESPLNSAVLSFGGGCNANKDPFGTMGPQFFPHANGMVGRSSALDDDDTDSFLVEANLKRMNKQGTLSGNKNDLSLSLSSSSVQQQQQQSPRALLPKFLLESRSDALALTRIVWHRTGKIPEIDGSTTLPYPALMSGRPDPDDLKSISTSLLIPFIAMASCQTGEETTDAEMRVYCAYSLPAVILLFGGMNWEKDGLKRCFLDLIGNRKGNRDGGEDENDMNGGADNIGNTVGNNAGPPLPVKRCLASSVHAVAHMLGPDIVSKDPAFLAAFEKAFLRDPDEAIRLNVLKNLASFLGALPPGDGPGHRNNYLPVLHTIIMGEDVLGAAKRRSASNPGVLNWRQRDAVARVLPDLIVLYDANLNREFLWPVLKTLLTDTVSAVRDNAGWSVPVLLRKYSTVSENENEVSDWMSEVTDWLRNTFLDEGFGENGMASPARLSGSFRRLKKQATMTEGAFSKRQGYCRILAAVALAMRMGEEDDTPDDNLSLESLQNRQGMPSVPVDPFGKMSPYERDHFRSILLHDLLPPALDMAVDCVANVRLTLTKCLKVLPIDVRHESHVEEVLSTLEEELMTWDVGDMPLNDANPGGILSATLSGDPPDSKPVLMTSTMSAC